MDIRLTAQGEGASVWVAGDLYTIKAGDADTQGAFALIESIVPPGGGPPPHIHRREDEAFYVLEGTLEFHADGQSFTAGPGAFVTLPKGSLHWFRNASANPARMIVLVVPAGLDRFFLEVGRPASEGSGGPPTPEELQTLISTAPKYGIEIHVPESAGTAQESPSAARPA